MLSCVPVLAEVGDKIPRLPVLFLWSTALVLLSWALIKKTKWLAIVVLPMAALFAVGATQEPRDEFVGPAIVHELGFSYIILAHVAAALPFIAILALILRRNEKTG